VQDLSRFALIEAGDAHYTHLEWLTWRHWLDEQQQPKLQAKRWLTFNYAYQMVQAALTGQGVVLGRTPLIAEHLASGELVEPLPHTRIESPHAYWLLVGPRAAGRPEIAAFTAWLREHARITRERMGEVEGNGLPGKSG
jgi:LysR family transcriptional regulator, glycine cleavage system transcriptional activator